MSRKVRVELSFTVEEGQDGAAVLGIVAGVASAEVNRRLGRKVPDVESPHPDDAHVARETTRRTRRTAEQIKADALAAEAGKANAVTEAAAAARAASILHDEDVAAHIEENKPSTADASSVVDDASSVGDEIVIEAEVVEEVNFDIEPEVPAVAEVTDADLNAATQRANGETKNTKAIRNLISSFNPDPTKVFQLRDIPAAKRADYIAALGKIETLG